MGKIKRIKRKINELIIHCTATDAFVPVTVNDLLKWHVTERGFSGIGYHYFIDIKGNIIRCRPIELVGAHCKGHNAHSIGICYAGGLLNGIPHDTRTIVQKESLHQLIQGLCITFPITKITGHNVYSNKSCPCFDASKEYSHLIKTLL